MPLEFNETKERLVLSLDAVSEASEAKKLVKELKDYINIYKIGMHHYLSIGPEIINIIQGEGGRIFFDGKFNDIPLNLGKTCEALLCKGIDFFSIHTTGGKKMITACVESAKEYAAQNGLKTPTILGVTILTSMGQKTINEELDIPGNLCKHITNLALIAKKNGLNGVVTSGCEARELRKKMGDDFIILSAAIRPTWSKVNDQMRVLTPREAILGGSDYIAIGRPITQAKKPVTAVKLIIDEINEAIEEKN